MIATPRQFKKWAVVADCRWRRWARASTRRHRAARDL